MMNSILQITFNEAQEIFNNNSNKGIPNHLNRVAMVFNKNEFDEINELLLRLETLEKNNNKINKVWHDNEPFLVVDFNSHILQNYLREVNAETENKNLEYLKALIYLKNYLSLAINVDFEGRYYLVSGIYDFVIPVDIGKTLHKIFYDLHNNQTEFK